MEIWLDLEYLSASRLSRGLWRLVSLEIVFFRHLFIVHTLGVRTLGGRAQPLGMEKRMDIFYKTVSPTAKAPEFLNHREAVAIRNFHKSFPEYAPTPLADLSALAGHIGVGGMFVKDESHRFGLNAFKVLGGSYAIGVYLAERLGLPVSSLSYEHLVSPEVKRQLGEITFVTATDGNHGRGVAWTADRLGQKSVVYMPKGSSRERLENIRRAGAKAEITNLNYDDTVRLASEMAKENNWVLFQDTAWSGYEEIPRLIMQGYCTMALEAHEQLETLDRKPTHVFVQAGVGSMAASVIGFLASVYTGPDRPLFVLVEPDKAACLYKTACAADGKLHAVTGNLNTIMAGLACGEVSAGAWPILDELVSAYCSCEDSLSALGMRVLGAPLPGDRQVVSGESGSIGVGVVVEIMRNPSHKEIRKALALDDTSQVLFLSTEGDTDREHYRRVVWDGLVPSGPEEIRLVYG